MLNKEKFETATKNKKLSYKVNKKGKEVKRS